MLSLHVKMVTFCKNNRDPKFDTSRVNQRIRETTTGPRNSLENPGCDLMVEQAIKKGSSQMMAFNYKHHRFRVLQAKAKNSENIC